MIHISRSSLASYPTSRTSDLDRGPPLVKLLSLSGAHWMARRIGLYAPDIRPPAFRYPWQSSVHTSPPPRYTGTTTKGSVLPLPRDSGCHQQRCSKGVLAGRPRPSSETRSYERRRTGRLRGGGRSWRDLQMYLQTSSSASETISNRTGRSADGLPKHLRTIAEKVGPKWSSKSLPSRRPISRYPPFPSPCRPRSRGGRTAARSAGQTCRRDAVASRSFGSPWRRGRRHLLVPVRCAGEKRAWRTTRDEGVSARVICGRSSETGGSWRVAVGRARRRGSARIRRKAVLGFGCC